MLKDERGHYDDGCSWRWKPEEYGSPDVIRKRDEHIYPYELYNFNEVVVLFLAPRVREIVAGLKGVYGVTGYFLWVEVALSQYSEYSEHEERDIVDASQVCPKDFNL